MYCIEFTENGADLQRGAADGEMPKSRSMGQAVCVTSDVWIACFLYHPTVSRCTVLSHGFTP